MKWKVTVYSRDADAPDHVVIGHAVGEDSRRIDVRLSALPLDGNVVLRLERPPRARKKATP